MANLLLSTWEKLPRLTLFGRSLLLVVVELIVNAVCWIVAGILFGRSQETQPILSLALLAWTLGLRHALDADHISAIDNATRGLISIGQLPVTCGLFFSLGHSTIVIVVNVAIAISTDIYDKLEGVGAVGGIVGAAVSGSFLFIIGLANSIILWKILRRRRQREVRDRARLTNGETGPFPEDEVLEDPKHQNMFMMRILGPIITFVDKPWKMYPVGVLFGFGFDTASSIALLAVSAIAKKGKDGQPIRPADIVILPLLFTAGMTMIDSADSILMIYSYAGFPDRNWAILQKPLQLPLETTESECIDTEPVLARQPSNSGSIDPTTKIPERDEDNTPAGPSSTSEVKEDVVAQEDMARDMRVKRNMMSGLSIVLTMMSIVIAFSISLITIMGLIGENCGRCTEAAEAEDGGGLEGRWWRGWQEANEQSGFIGAAIIGAFILVVVGWYGSLWAVRRFKSRGIITQ